MTPQEPDMQASENTIKVISILHGNNPTKTQIMEEGRTSPVETPATLLGDGLGSAYYGMDVGLQGVKASVRVVVAVGIKCDSDARKQMLAVDHCRAMVSAVLADDMLRMEQAMHVLSDTTRTTE